MRGRLIHVVGLIVLILAFQQSSGAEEESGHSRDVFAGVPLLKKRVAYSEAKIPLGELIRKVAEDTGTALAVTRDIENEPVAVAVRDIPANRLLQELASLLEYRWSRRGEEGAWRFELWQDLVSKQREEALRQAAFADVERRLRDELDVFLKVARLPEGEIKELLRAAQRERSPLDVPQERKRMYRAASFLSSPVRRSMARLVGSLSPQQWSLLREGRRVVFSTAAQLGEFGLPVEIPKVFQSFQPAINEANVDEDTADDWLRRQVKDEQAQWAAASGYRVTIQLSGGLRQYKIGGSMRLEARAVPIVPRSSSRSPFFWGQTCNPLIVTAGPVDSQAWRRENTQARRTALQKDPVLGAKRRLSVKLAPRLRPFWPGNIGVWRLPELLPELARTYGVDLISDAYWNAPSVGAGDLSDAGPTPLFSLLDQLAGRHYRWDRQEKLIRLRSRTWFFDRPREIPLHLVLRWKQLCDRHGALPLEEYATNVAALSDDQLQSLTDVGEMASFPVGIHDLAMSYTARHALRLYAALDPAQRQALWQGRTLELSPSLPVQHRLFLAELDERDAVRTMVLTPQDLLATKLSLVKDSAVRTKEEQKGVTRYRNESVAEAGQLNGPMAHTASRGPVGAARAPAREQSRPAKEGVPVAPGIGVQIKRFPVMSLTFQFQWGPELPQPVYLIIASPPD